MRLQKGWSLEETAKRIGVSVETVCTYQRGTNPNFKYLTKIAKAFDISLERLVTGTEAKPKAAIEGFDRFKKYYASASEPERKKIAKYLEATSLKKR
jgi:transcriptional regulator with XRE-family HTH domain